MPDKRDMRRILYITVLCCFFLLILTACGNTSQTAPPTEQRDPSVITVETASATKMTLDSKLDLLCGITRDGDTLIAYGMREGEAVFLYMDNSGNISKERSVSTEMTAQTDAFIYELVAVNNSLYALFGSAKRGLNQETFQLCVINDAGMMHVLTDITNNDFWNQGSFVRGDGIPVFWFGNKIVSISGDGTCHMTELAVSEELVSFFCKDNAEYAFFLDDKDCIIREYSQSDGTLEEIATVSLEEALAACQCDSTGGNLFLNSETHLLEYQPDTKLITPRFSWTQLNLAGDAVGGVIETASNRFVCVIPEKKELLFIETKEEEIERTEIIVGALENSFAHNLEYCVSMFNSKSEKYYARIQYYPDDTGLSTAIATGDAPDILEMSQVKVPVKREYFLDMIPYLREKGFEAEDFTGNMWMALQKENQILMIPDSVRIDTVTARSKVVGTEPGWTWEEMYQVVEEKGNDLRIFPGWMTADDVMLWMSANSLGRFIDYSTMTCHFDDEEFIKYLSFCERASSGIREEEDYSENVLLEIEGIGILWRIIIIRQNYGGEDFTFIGFPDDTGENGSIFRCANSCLRFCIPRNAETPDGAGEFLSFLLSSEWQNQVMEMPVMQEVLNLRLSDISTPDGVQATDLDIEKLEGLIDNTNRFVYEDLVILNIVREEAAAYLSHQKSAEEVAAIVQDRVSIYLQEKGD